MKKRRNIGFALLWTAVFILSLWTGLTIWVEMEGPARWTQLGSSNDSSKVLVLYDPDPIYNLDEQLCTEIGKGIAEYHTEVIVATVAAVRDINLADLDGIVLCANTYNWAPDWAITGYIRSRADLDAIPVVAVTIGSGSTSAAHHRLNKLLASKDINVIDTHEWWLMRPNDESRMQEGNVAVARDEALQFGRKVGTEFRSISR